SLSAGCAGRSACRPDEERSRWAAASARADAPGLRLERGRTYGRSGRGQCDDRRREAADRAPYPREDVLGGCERSGSDRGQRREKGNRVAVHWADEAVEPVPPEPGTPVEVRLEQREGDGGREPEAECAGGDA